MTRYAQHVNAEVIGGDKRPENGYLVISIIELILGVVLLIWPVSSLVVVCVMMGIGLLVAGVMGLVQGIQVPVVGVLTQGASIVSIVAGLALIFGNAFFIAIIPMTFGLIILAGGIYKLLQVLNGPRQTASKVGGVVLCAVMLILALVIMVHPFGTMDVVMRFVGVLLIINAVVDLWYLFKRRRGQL